MVQYCNLKDPGCVKPLLTSSVSKSWHQVFRFRIILIHSASNNMASPHGLLLNLRSKKVFVELTIFYNLIYEK